MNIKRNHVKDFTTHIKNICSLLQVPLLEIPDGDKKKRTVVSLIVLQTHTVRVESYALYAKDEISEEDAQRLKLTLINAEDYFIDNNKLWVGDIKKVFSDYSITLENKYGQLVWCGTPYRSSMEEFYVDLNLPIMTTNYYTLALEKLSSGKGMIELSQLSNSTDDQRRFILNDLKTVKQKAGKDETLFTDCGPVHVGIDSSDVESINAAAVVTGNPASSPNAGQQVMATKWGKFPGDIDN